MKVVSNLVLQNCDSSFLDVAIETEFLSVKLAQNCRETILSVKVRVHHMQIFNLLVRIPSRLLGVCVIKMMSSKLKEGVYVKLLY